MTPTLAIAASVAATLLVLAVVALLSRRLQIVRRMAFPLYVAGIAAGLKVSLTLIGEPPGGLERALSWTLTFLAAILVLRLAGLWLFDVYLPSGRGLKLPPLLPAVAMGAIYFVTAIVTLRVSYPELPLAPLLTTSAVTSLVLGLALQPILGNFFAGVVISVEQPFRINDWVKVGDREGRVAKITWRTTHLRTRDNDTLVIPNSKLADETILNFNYPHPLHLERVHVGAHYRTPPYRVEQALLAVAAKAEAVLDNPTPAVFLASFDDSAITYELRVWIEDVSNRPRIASQLRYATWEEFKRRGISIPYPIRTLEIEPQARTLELARPVRRAAAADGVPPPARLVVSRGPDRGASCALGAEPATVGRSSGCSLPLSEPKASKEHLRVEWRGERYVAVDLASQYGTLVDGANLDERPLAHLDHLAIGDTVLVFELEGS